MFRSALLWLIVFLLALSIFVSLRIPSLSLAFWLASFLIFVSVAALLIEVWILDSRMLGRGRRRYLATMGNLQDEVKFGDGEEDRNALVDSFSKMTFLVKNASSDSSYSKTQIAEILREALLNQYYGYGTFPMTWIATRDGDQAIQSILKSKNSQELMDVFEIPDRFSARSGMVWIFDSLFNYGYKKKRSKSYIKKIESALSLLQNGEAKRL
jgi:hypothetical protein